MYLKMYVFNIGRFSVFLIDAQVKHVTLFIRSCWHEIIVRLGVVLKTSFTVVIHLTCYIWNTWYWSLMCNLLEFLRTDCLSLLSPVISVLCWSAILVFAAIGRYTMACCQYWNGRVSVVFIQVASCTNLINSWYCISFFLSLFLGYFNSTFFLKNLKHLPFVLSATIHFGGFCWFCTNLF